jgi:hypothetical protein
MSAKKNSMLVLFIVFAFVVIGFDKAIALDNAPFEGVYSKCALSIFSVVSKPTDGFIRCCILRSEGPNKGKIDCITCEEGKADTTCVESTHKKTAVRPKIPGGAPSQLAPPKPLTRTEKLKRGRFNPGNTPGKLAPPGAPATTPAQRARGRFMGRQGFAPMAR